MRGTTSVIAIMAVLASGSAALAQDAAGAPVFQLTGTGGVTGFSIPTFDTGFFDHTASGNLFGGMLGLSASGAVGNLSSDFDVIVGFNAFGAFGMGTSSWTDTFSGPGTVTVSGMTLPGGAAAMSLDPGGGTDVSVTGANGTTGTITSAGGTVNAGFVALSGGGPGFIGGVYADDGAGTEMSGGFIGDTSGGVAIITGDLDGLSIDTTTARSVTYLGADLTLGIGGQVSDTVAVQLYGGPSYRGLNETDKTTVTIDFPEQSPSAVTFPEFSIGQTDTLTSHYLGGLVGGSASIVTSPGVVFTLGLEGGVYNVSASWSGSNTYSTCCGDFQTPPGGVGGTPSSGASPNYSVSTTPTTFNFASATAFNAKASAGVTFALDANKAVTVGGSAEYLSHVAQVDHGAQTSYTPGAPGGAVDLTAVPAPGAPVFSWGSMFNFTGTVSLTGTF